MALDIINISLCIVIMLLGYLGSKKRGNKLALFIAVAFCLFGISHVLTMLGMGTSLLNLIVVIRAVAYLIVIVGLYNVISE
jgi:hypothetical protein